MFKDHMQPLIMPQYLPGGHLLTQSLKPVHVIFEDSGNDSVVELPAHMSATNSHKAVCAHTSHFTLLIYFQNTKGIMKNVRTLSKQSWISSNELDGADEQQDCIEALHEQYQCNTYSKAPESPVYCYHAKNSTDCYTLTHNYISA